MYILDRGTEYDTQLCTLQHFWTACNTLLQHSATEIADARSWHIVLYPIQHPPSHCNTLLQHSATECRVLLMVTPSIIPGSIHSTPSNTLPHAATHYNMLQHTRLYTLQHPLIRCNTLSLNPKISCIHCNTLQYSATRCNTLQHTHCNRLSLNPALYIATTYNNIQHTATHALQRLSLNPAL